MNDHMMDSFVEIELFQEYPYVSGEPLYGTVHLFAKNNLNNVSQISLTLKGQEQVFLHLGKEPIEKEHEIVEKKFVLYDYVDFYNVVQAGSYCYPFTLYLPDWLPQSHLCLYSGETLKKKDKKYQKVNNFRVSYNLIVNVESSDSLNPLLSHSRRLSVLTPEYSPPIYDQQVHIQANVKKMGVFNFGQSSFTCLLQKDVLYPKEMLNLQVCIDNTKCRKSIEKYTARLLRRIQVFNLEQNEPVFFTDQILSERVYQSNCAKQQSEQVNFELEIPESLHWQDTEAEKMPAVPIIEKNLSYGPSSSMTGKLFKVQYVVQFFVKHRSIGSALRSLPEASIPIMIMTPSKNVMDTEKPKRKKHPKWDPYSYKLKDFFLTPEEEHDSQPYSKYRKWLIEREKQFVESQIQKQTQTFDELEKSGDLSTQKFKQRQTLIQNQDLQEDKPQYFDSNKDFYDVYNNPDV